MQLSVAIKAVPGPAYQDDAAELTPEGVHVRVVEAIADEESIGRARPGSRQGQVTSALRRALSPPRSQRAPVLRAQTPSLATVLEMPGRTVDRAAPMQRKGWASAVDARPRLGQPPRARAPGCISPIGHFEISAVEHFFLQVRIDQVSSLEDADEIRSLAQTIAVHRDEDKADRPKPPPPDDGSMLSCIAAMQFAHQAEKMLIDESLDTWRQFAAIAFATASEANPYSGDIAARRAMLALRRQLLGVARDLIALREAIERRQYSYNAAMPRECTKGWVQNPINLHAPSWARDAQDVSELTKLYRKHLDALCLTHHKVETVETIMTLTAKAIFDVYAV